MPPQTEWTFDAAGKPVEGVTTSSNAVAIRVLALPNAEVHVRAESLRPQILALYTKRLATTTNAIFSPDAHVKRVFTPRSKAEGDSDAEIERLEATKHVFLAYLTSDDAVDGSSDSATTDSNTAVGFARVYEEPGFDAIVGSALVVDSSLPASQQDALQCALYYATKTIGEAMARSMLIERRAKAELAADTSAASDKHMTEDVPVTQDFYRSLQAVTEFEKTLLAADGFVDRPERLEMTKFLRRDDCHDELQDVVFPDDVDVRALDLSDIRAVHQYYDTLKLAFGNAAPVFAAWKIHYGQQPRLAPELSFVAWRKSDGIPLAAIGIERLVEGEGGGDDEVMRIYATNAKLVASRAVNNNDSDGSAPTEQSDDSPLEFAADFDTKKAAIVQQATVAYVCGVATTPASRGKGLASGLLRHAFNVAARTSSLREITLGTDVANKYAVRAYRRAGMVETKRASSGFSLVKEVAFEPQTSP